MKSILNLTEAGNLAVHALAYMATLGVEKPVSAALIASEINVSESHLGKVLQRLAKKDFIRSTRGAKGGFYFHYDPSSLTFLEILEAVDGLPESEGCLLGERVCEAGECKLQGLLHQVSALVRDKLSSITLGDIVITPALRRREALAG